MSSAQKSTRNSRTAVLNVDHRSSSSDSSEKISSEHSAALVADVWLDNYKRLFYKQRPQLENVTKYDSVVKSKTLQRQKCSTFQYYLEHVYPEKFVIDEHSVAWGFVANDLEGRRLCLDTLGQDEQRPFQIGLQYCQQSSEQQVFALNLHYELRREESCAEPFQSSSLKGAMQQQTVRLVTCLRSFGESSATNEDQRQNWSYDVISGLLRNMKLGLCLTSMGVNIGDHKILAECNPNDFNQNWRWENIRKL